MFLTRFGREIAIRLKSGLSTSESLDIWKLLESAVSINRNLYMLDNSELGKLCRCRIQEYEACADSLWFIAQVH